jgi:beta-N-acetylhexosaminidase
MWKYASIVLLALGANYVDPYLTPLGPWAPGLIAAAGTAGALVLWRRREWRRSVTGALLLASWIGVPVAVAVAKAAFELRKASVLAAPAEKTRRLGKRFVVGYDSFAEVERLAVKGLIAGVYVTGRNARGRSIEDLRDEISRLQEARRKARLPPLLVAADQEGGFVSHLSPPLTVLPMLSELAGAGPGKRADAAREQGAAHGRQLASVGVNVNLAPVLDLRRNHPFNAFDRNSQIEKRAISGDPDIVAEVGLAYSQGLAQSGVTAAVKHFPGLGRLTTDTHHFRASIDASSEELETSDWAPFRRVLANSNAMMMVGHVTLTAIDPDHPASHSRAVIDGVLRRKWGYQGVLITDDMNMSPIYHHGLCDAVTGGLNAGMDLLLIAFDGRQYYRAMRCALDAQDQGRLDQAMLAESEKRLAVIDQSPTPALASRFQLRLSARPQVRRPWREPGPPRGD